MYTNGWNETAWQINLNTLAFMKSASMIRPSTSARAKTCSAVWRSIGLESTPRVSVNTASSPKQRTMGIRFPLVSCITPKNCSLCGSMRNLARKRENSSGN
jgi:hypothetical protein